VQWLLDAHSSYGKNLTPDQLAQDLFVIMTASIHSTSGTALCILYDIMNHPEAVDEIREEIVRVQAAHPVWTRQALGELRVLDSFMRESSRMHALTQCKCSQYPQIPIRTPFVPLFHPLDNLRALCIS
jgi:cytochrome P450